MVPVGVTGAARINWLHTAYGGEAFNAFPSSKRVKSKAKKKKVKTSLLTRQTPSYLGVFLKACSLTRFSMDEFS